MFISSLFNSELLLISTWPELNSENISKNEVGLCMIYCCMNLQWRPSNCTNLMLINS